MLLSVGVYGFFFAEPTPHSDYQQFQEECEDVEVMNEKITDSCGNITFQEYKNHTQNNPFTFPLNLGASMFWIFWGVLFGAIPTSEYINCRT